MQPFNLTVEGDSDTISDELAGALHSVFGTEPADQHSADIAHTLAAAAVDLIGENTLGTGVLRYTVSVTGTQTPGAGYDGLDSVHLHIGASGRTITDTPSDSPPASQV